MMWCLQYLYHTSHLGIEYHGNKTQGVTLEKERRRGVRRVDMKPDPRLLSESYDSNLVGYCDADHAGCVDTRRSTAGIVSFLNGGPISWSVKLLVPICLSTTEAELLAMGLLMREMRYLQMLLGELGFTQPRRRPGHGGAIAFERSEKNSGSILYEDNNGALCISQNNGEVGRTKHMDLMYKFIQQYVELGYISVQRCDTHDMIADILTKPVARPTFVKLSPLLMGTWHKSLE